MCNLYRTPSSAAEIIRISRAMDRTGNKPWEVEVYPDRVAPIIRNRVDGPELVKARWGMPSPRSALKTARDPGVTNVRNLGSPHWRRWLGADHRCIVPLEAFAEPGPGRKPVWFEAADDQPMFFAGIEVRGWKSVRKVKDGETTDDLFAFLTCRPNAEVGAVHPKAMPVILRSADEWEAWLAGIPAAEFQRPLPDGALVLVDGAE
ncbi:SOS response-associated peptidase family protein [Pontibaca methylaminivorans]|uniref:Abasic site processing protein n=1 Tax=Pontibaca methylaminivorans TaxID=515897 RepID=A0A1R3W9Y4_9RHOB|nr:SOS response-associated peptidase family protein [Pontibaca methylaminivorans]SIT74859.1 Putative SOS response-associated peptidase YedK [Pontibaca methylaminivorans]